MSQDLLAALGAQTLALKNVGRLWAPNPLPSGHILTAGPRCDRLSVVLRQAANLIGGPSAKCSPGVQLAAGTYNFLFFLALAKVVGVRPGLWLLPQILPQLALAMRCAPAFRHAPGGVHCGWTGPGVLGALALGAALLRYAALAHRSGIFRAFGMAWLRQAPPVGTLLPVLRCPGWCGCADRSTSAASCGPGVLLRGRRTLERLAACDVFVFDKSGTLTKDRPRVVEVIAFGDVSRDSVLRTAARLERHFPHAMAAAVLRRAEAEGLIPDEGPAEVEYVRSHGLASRLDGQYILVGSRRFVHGDHGVDLARAVPVEWAMAYQGFSLLYVAVAGRLAGVLVLADPLRPRLVGVLARLRQDGVRRMVLLTGDHELAARSAATALGVDEYHAQARPEDKAAIVRRLQAKGHAVAMVGHGVNDAAALALADVGIVPASGAVLALEAGDVVLRSGLQTLPELRRLARTTAARVRRSQGFFVVCSGPLSFLLAAIPVFADGMRAGI